MLKAQPLNCTLKRDAQQPSSTDAMIAILAKEFEALDVQVADTIRIAAHNVLAGVTSDEGKRRLARYSKEDFGGRYPDFGNAHLDGPGEQRRQARYGADGRLS